jgi:putative Mg2+ transporter-C (MgtC) family protein
VLRLDYFHGQDALRAVLSTCTEQGWAVRRLNIHRESTTDEGQSVASVTLALAGRGDLVTLAAEIAHLPGVRAARTGDEDLLDEE